MARDRTTLQLNTYGSLIANRLRELRDRQGWTMESFRDKLNEMGITQDDGSRIPLSTCYSWERGKENKGADLPLWMFPVIAEMHGFYSVGDWLPNAKTQEFSSR